VDSYGVQSDNAASFIWESEASIRPGSTSISVIYRRLVGHGSAPTTVRDCGMLVVFSTSAAVGPPGQLVIVKSKSCDEYRTEPNRLSSTYLQYHHVILETSSMLCSQLGSRHSSEQCVTEDCSRAAPIVRTQQQRLCER